MCLTANRREDAYLHNGDIDLLELFRLPLVSKLGLRISRSRQKNRDLGPADRWTRCQSHCTYFIKRRDPFLAEPVTDYSEVSARIQMQFLQSLLCADFEVRDR